MGLAAPGTRNPLNGNGSRIHYSNSSLPPKPIFSTFKYENGFKTKNKPYPA
jgi:hypothetical protein